MYDQSFGDVTKDVGPSKRQAPASNTKLVLLFFILVVGTYTIIIQHKFHLPDAEGSGRTHRKHLRMEMHALRDQFQSHSVNSSRKAVASRANVGQMLDVHGLSHLTNKAQQQNSGGGSGAAASSRAGAGSGRRGAAGDTTVSVSSRREATGTNKVRATAVKAAMTHAWRGYERYAWGKDELLPEQRQGKNSFAGMGATLLDGLSTLWIMGLKEEFYRGRDWVATNLTFPMTTEISLFETNIRVVGGLLSAYDFSGDKAFLRRVTELVDLMLPAMDNSTTGIPANSIMLGQASNSYRTTASIAECGSLQLEWTALSMRSGNNIYAEKSQKIFHAFHDVYPDQGLIPTTVNRDSGSGGPSFSVGAAADSYYEYLLKLWLLGGQKEDLWRHMWERAVDDALARLLGTTKASNLSYFGVSNYGHLEARQEHLACFFPGNMALGVYTGAVTGDKAAEYVRVAEAVTYTCWQMYERQPSGLSPEAAVMYDSQDKAHEMTASPSYNILRPETVESFFYLWRVTGDPVYQEWGWKVFQAFEKYCKVDNGYVGTPDVTRVPPPHDDTQQSFFLAETLKYLYLLFSSEEVLPLDAYVFNTEAHPFKLPRGIKSQRGSGRQRGRLKDKSFAGLLNQT